MNLAILLFALRLVSAALLLVLLGGMAWLIYREMHASAAAAARSALGGHLRVVESPTGFPAVGTSFPLLATTSLGRAESNAIMLEDSFVSGEHARIARVDGQWRLEDLQSRNGTLLNGRRLDETAVLTPGDVITIGSVRLQLEA